MSEQLIQIRSNLAAVQDHSRHYADFAFVYPVISRRSRGLSIGINLNPDKACNFDCVYCQVDRRVPGRVSELNLNQLRDELIAMIRFAKDGGLAKEPKFKEVAWLARDIKDLAISGDGEPTMIHNFADYVSVVAEARHAERLDKAKIVLVTDAAGLDRADVRRGLTIMDANNGEIWAKLDAGTEDYFCRINRTSIRFDRILKNLLATARVRPIVLQSLFLKLDGQPISSEELDAYCQRVNEIARGGGKIQEIHAYTIARPTAEPNVSKLLPEELDGIAEIIRNRTQLPVLAFS